MARKPFGEDLWKTMGAVKVDGKNGIKAPVTASGKDGINVEGIDVVGQRQPGILARIIRRLRHR